MTTNPARQRLKTWRAIMAYAFRKGEIEDDSSRVISQRKSRKPVKHIPWLVSDVAAFRKQWASGTRQRLAMEI
ncbi:MAG: hypothetical protein ACI92Z_000192 [Paracoccaceae bacterium]|jgi:hypothetical protein